MFPAIMPWPMTCAWHGRTWLKSRCLTTSGFMLSHTHLGWWMPFLANTRTALFCPFCSFMVSDMMNVHESLSSACAIFIMKRMVITPGQNIWHIPWMGSLLAILLLQMPSWSTILGVNSNISRTATKVIHIVSRAWYALLWNTMTASSAPC